MYAIAEAIRERQELTPVRFLRYTRRGKIPNRGCYIRSWANDANGAKTYSRVDHAFRALANLSVNRNPSYGTEYCVIRIDENVVSVVSGAFGR